MKFVAAVLFTIALFFGAVVALAGEVPKAPVISAEHQAAFQTARANYDEAQMQAKAADELAKSSLEAFNLQIKVLQDDCGPLWQTQLDKDKKAYCGEKPAPAKAEAKK